MEPFEVDKALKSILDTSTPLDKKKKKRGMRFFQYLGGGESPLEAVELALRRDEKLQRAQLRTTLEIVALLEFPAEGSRKPDLKSMDTVMHNLFHCNLLCLSQRLLRIHLPDDIACDGIPWKAIYYNSISIIKALLDYAEGSDAHIKSIVETDTVEILLDYCDGSADVLTTYPAISTLKALCLKSPEATERIIFSNGLSKIGHFILKDNCQKHMIKLYNQGVKPYQNKVLQNYYDLYQDYYSWEVMYPDVSYRVLKVWSTHIQMCSALIILKIADQNDRHRKIIFKDKVISKALLKWLKAPAILHTECSLIDACVRIIAVLCLSEDIAWQLVDKYNLIKHLAQGVQFTERTILTSFLEVVLQLSRHSGRCREAILESKEILQSLSMYIFSFQSEIQDYTLKTLDLLVPCSHSRNIVTAGIKPASLILLGHFYEPPVGLHAKHIKQTLSRSCTREWKNEEAAFGKTRKEFLQSLDGEQARRLKDLGNDKFKEEEYSEAIYMYTKALNVCPLSVRTTKDGKQAWKWWVLPAVLYSNRAQCYLKIEDWSAAARDCSNAIARCLEDGEEAEKIIKKTACRRAKAMLELGIYPTSLNDIAYCMRKGYTDDNTRVLYTQILAKYRKHIGPEPIRRCGLCMGGEGEKLKRCANCMEVYCCRECQLQAWENGHKNVCNNNG